MNTAQFLTLIAPILSLVRCDLVIDSQCQGIAIPVYCLTMRLAISILPQSSDANILKSAIVNQY